MLKLTAVLLVIFAYTSSANLAEGIVEKISHCNWWKRKN